ncbi:MAG TPA: hypothetical protein VI382_00815, partial [Candidatus Manganitrophaceae bacterium]|nr:hypothetical protein [Candidatus Manganitrophaceae bacterium]
MGIYMIRAFFVSLSAFAGYSFASKSFEPEGAALGAAVGLLLGGGLVALEILLTKTTAKKLLWGLLGFFLGLLASGLLN